ncbi:PAS domain-containing protein [Mitsuaria sp. WAJ17]|uniref:methyl-accepting chemotaxis protein n=1 Tax=Mitsuaria sp. WAJ17 TaxID=2761452 RepID=UPI0016026ACA|nr:PAS domain-containing methyl-accepting chemotaxis protein [Mitsuaria sp. WAJ17]MBB2484651.1 PAS domain-containing protein [Mitsuaria sp. WAJ17]
MRNNQPVTDREYLFPPGQNLVSTTDLQGRILYCNPAFVEVSGFERDELLGQPHNMIRHPDMPPEAFRDMWETIASGHPWSGLVKNRRKNGDHYWVMANVTPLMEGSRVAGYMSVRTEPEREHVRAAEALYRKLRHEADQGRPLHRLHRGQLVRVDLLGRLRARLQLGPQGALAGLFLLQALLLALVFQLGSAWAVAAGVLSALAGSWLARRLLAGPLDDLLPFANRMAAGDLTQSISQCQRGHSGRLALAMNQLNVNLQSVVRDARTEAHKMQAATSDIATGNLELSQRTESQASSLQQTAASMEQITGTVRQTTASAHQATVLAREASAVAANGQAAVDEVSRTMDAIRQSSSKMADIIQVIDTIAFQTNILALNAAVEAARAGDSGRGFAVVASEVRALAQRSATAAREIKALIEASASDVEAGHRHAGEAQQTMHGAVESVQRVAALISGIERAATEQLDGISQVNSAVASLDIITQQNAALVEQIAAAAAALKDQADTVSDTVSIFKVEWQREAAEAPDAVALRKSAKARRQGLQVRPVV